MRVRWSILIVAAACNFKSSTPDALPSGPATLTVAPNALGLVVSDPAGIECGACGLLPPTMCSDLTNYTQCSAMVKAGTTVTLSITERQDYPDVTCSSDTDTDPRVMSCTFVVEFPMTVEIFSLTL